MYTKKGAENTDIPVEISTENLSGKQKKNEELIS